MAIVVMTSMFQLSCPGTGPLKSAESGHFEQAGPLSRDPEKVAKSGEQIGNAIYKCAEKSYQNAAFCDIYH
jgi:hypothetical protein